MKAAATPTDRFWSKVLKALAMAAVGCGPALLPMMAMAAPLLIRAGNRRTPQKWRRSEAYLQCPIFVRPDPGHLIAGTQREDMLDRLWDGRHARGASWHWRGTGRAAFAAKSHALRDTALEHGWNPAGFF